MVWVKINLVPMVLALGELSVSFAFFKAVIDLSALIRYPVTVSFAPLTSDVSSV